jgi:hypothetical protein
MISRVHISILCVDERSACKRHVLEVLRQSLRESIIDRQFSQESSINGANGADLAWSYTGGQQRGTRPPVSTHRARSR